MQNQRCIFCYDSNTHALNQFDHLLSQQEIGICSTFSYVVLLDLTWFCIGSIFLYCAVTLGLETMATLALTVNLTTYLNRVMHFELPDAANHVTNFVGTSYILPLFWAIPADLYIGRFKTILVSGSLEFAVYIHT